MRISIKDIKEMRPVIAAKLNDMPAGCQISINKELLEQLLFDVRIAKNSGLRAKFPVWLGEFLAKISNLSEVSFDGVVLDPLNPEYEIADFFDKDISDILLVYKNAKGAIINYGNCGITIDIPRTFTIMNYEFQKGSNPNIPKPILASLDLSGSSLMDGKKPCNICAYFSEIIDSSLSYAKVLITLSQGACIRYSSLRGIDLSEYILNYKVLSKSGINKIILYKTDLSDTGLVIDAHNIEDKESGQVLGNAISSGLLNHCVVNNVRISTPEEQAANALQQKKLYEIYKRNLLGEIDIDIIIAQESR